MTVRLSDHLQNEPLRLVEILSDYSSPYCEVFGFDVSKYKSFMNSSLGFNPERSFYKLFTGST